MPSGQVLAWYVKLMMDHSGPTKDIGAALQLDYGTLTPLIKRLEASGLVRRERRPDDERTVQVSLTEQGTQLREGARTVPAAIGDSLACRRTASTRSSGSCASSRPGSPRA
ncbi:transcriptional regulator, SarA/Rot family [Streptomyces sp. NBC_01445]|uniref:transcriptional regulator, SarA/Rot family n=1 Tax=Streptomyces sp. NBC_01445 TaxID=2903869 RepID=UPI002DDAE939|nr:MarR family transcriptional regulator [Streptomyces sp. NBC_01445]